MSFLKVLNEFADYRDKAGLKIDQATVAVTPKYAQRALRLKKDQPLEYRGLHLNCIGSPKWRRENRV
jgi:hypothetical protein